MNRSLLLAALLGSACGSAVAAAAVTVAFPVSTDVTESARYSASLESPQRVEIRPRVSGPIVRAAFTEGALVQKGALLFVIDPRPFEVVAAAAEANLTSAKADQALAAQQLSRADTLVKANAITQQEWETRSATVAQLAGRVQAAEAALKAAQLDLEFTQVRSPIAGRVGRKLVTEGNLVGPGTPTPLTTVHSVDPLHAYFDVEAPRAMQLSRGERLTALISFADDDVPREAVVDFVDNHVDSSSGTVKFRAVVPNPGGQLSGGLFAHVQLPMGAPHPGLLVADQAINTDQDRRFVWVVGADGKVSYRAVKLGALFDGLRLVQDGLQETDRVLVRGLQRPHAGDVVTAQVVSMRELDRPLIQRTER